MYQIQARKKDGPWVDFYSPMYDLIDADRIIDRPLRKGFYATRAVTLPDRQPVTYKQWQKAFNGFKNRG